MLRRLLACALLLLSAQVWADEFQPCPSQLIDPNVAAPKYQDELILSPYTYHFSYSPEHRPVHLVGYVHHLPGGTFCGASLFTNSFGQPSVYAYIGKTYNNFWSGHPNVYAEVSAGILYGYVGQYKNKVPLNVHGFSPAIIPSIGYRFTEKDSASIYLLGNSALMFGYSRMLD